MLFHKRGPRVEAEAAALAAARHPGVVELVGLEDGVLQTLMLEGLSLGELGPLPADEVAGVAAAVGTTLADLHELGVVHGGVEASHVLVCADGRLVLCSLGRGGTPADDVAALGRLVADLLATTAAPSTERAKAAADVPGAGAEPPLRPDATTRMQASALGQRRTRRLRSGRRRHTLGRAHRGRLGAMLAPPAAPVMAALAAEATDPDPSLRPSARAFATAVHQRVPTARLPALPRRPLLPLPPAPAPLARRFRSAWPCDASSARRGLPMAAAMAGAVVLVALATWLRADPNPGPRPRGSGEGHARPIGTASAEARPRVAPEVAAPTTDTPPVATRVWPPDPLHFADGVLTMGGARYAVGASGDSVAAGDWACTGRRTLALLRSGTGELFVFDRWADPGQNLPARPVGRVAGAMGIRAVDADGNGCDRLEVARNGKPPVHLEIDS